MAMDTGILYGEMFGSFVAHLAIPFIVYVILSAMGTRTAGVTFLVLIGLLSFGTQFAFLTGLQASTCSGIHNYRGIFTGSAIAALLTVGLASVPVFVEGMRLPISQLFMEHYPESTPQLEALEEVLNEAAKKFATLQPQKGGALNVQDYESQTFKEIATGAAYWSAFAGAYGIGIGSLLAGKCSESTPKKAQ